MKGTSFTSSAVSVASGNASSSPRRRAPRPWDRRSSTRSVRPVAGAGSRRPSRRSSEPASTTRTGSSEDTPGNAVARPTTSIGVSICPIAIPVGSPSPCTRSAGSGPLREGRRATRSSSDSSENASSQKAAPTIVSGSIADHVERHLPGEHRAGVLDPRRPCDRQREDLPAPARSWSIMTCTSLPTNTPAFASTVDRSDPTIVWESMKMPRQSADCADEQHGELRQTRQAVERRGT